jgi:hypothetical protein
MQNQTHMYMSHKGSFTCTFDFAQSLENIQNLYFLKCTSLMKNRALKLDV